jgi:hypothetical protein
VKKYYRLKCLEYPASHCEGEPEREGLPGDRYLKTSNVINKIEGREMNDFTLEELNVLVDVFARASLSNDESLALELKSRVEQAFGERQELESLDFEDCLSCKL